MGTESRMVAARACWSGRGWLHTLHSGVLNSTAQCACGGQHGTEHSETVGISPDHLKGHLILIIADKELHRV